MRPISCIPGGLAMLVCAGSPANASDGFASELSFYGWTTWGFILLYAGLGALARMAVEHRRGRLSGRVAELLELLFVGAVSGLVAFAALEALCQWRGVRLPSGSVGLVVLVAAYNSQRTLAAASLLWTQSTHRLTRRPPGGRS